MKKCIKCDKEYEDDVNYCSLCGDNLTQSNRNAILELYRVSRFYCMMNSFSIYLDGKEICKLKNGQKLQVKITDGKHNLEVQINWSGYSKSKPIAFFAKEGDVIKYRFNFNFGIWGSFFAMFKEFDNPGTIVSIEEY